MIILSTHCDCLVLPHDSEGGDLVGACVWSGNYEVGMLRLDPTIDQWVFISARSNLAYTQGFMSKIWMSLERILDKE
ncbi:hypothetical protein LCGC14_0143080 [marine sediment metagenome]|uniref:Uncharacterized protein n=1 Tax=marine sediment metagenome TaxID=412755 RepID=A0A0F9XIL9_9ZZZZ